MMVGAVIRLWCFEREITEIGHAYIYAIILYFLKNLMWADVEDLQHHLELHNERHFKTLLCLFSSFYGILWNIIFIVSIV